MDSSLRSARRFEYNGAEEAASRPIPRVIRPAMDTIGRVQPRLSETPVRAQPLAVEKAPTSYAVPETPKEVVVNNSRPALHLDSHPSTLPPEEAPVSIAEKIEELPVLSEEDKWVKTTDGKRKRRLPLKPRQAIVAAAMLLVVGGVGVLLKPTSTPESPETEVLSAHTEAASSAASSAVSPVVYDEPPANYLKTYQVGKMQARIITISSINLEARVVPVGVDGRGQPQLPSHAYDTGWYNVSARPGEAGTVVVSGACPTEAGNGIFDKLGDLQTGDVISIERGDGVLIRYSVKDLYRSPVDTLDMTKVLSPLDAKAPGLSLVTCDGTYNRATNDSADRLVVRAIQI